MPDSFLLLSDINRYLDVRLSSLIHDAHSCMMVIATADLVDGDHQCGSVLLSPVPLAPFI